MWNKRMIFSALHFWPLTYKYFPSEEISRSKSSCWWNWTVFSTQIYLVKSNLNICAIVLSLKSGLAVLCSGHMVLSSVKQRNQHLWPGRGSVWETDLVKPKNFLLGCLMRLSSQATNKEGHKEAQLVGSNIVLHLRLAWGAVELYSEQASRVSW